MYWTGTSIDPPTTQATSEEQVYFQRLATILTAYSDIDARTSNVMFNVFNQNGTPQNGSIAIASLYVRFQTEVLDPLTALGAPSPRLAAAHDELRAAAVAERAALESLNAGLRHVNANELNQGNDQRAIAKQQSSAAFDAWKSLYGDSPVQPGPGQTIN